MPQVATKFRTAVGFALTTESVQVLGENPERKGLILQNKGSVDMFYAWDKDASVVDSFRLQPGALIGFDVLVPTNAIYARLASASVNNVLSVTEA